MGFKFGKSSGNDLAFFERLIKHRQHFNAEHVEDIAVTCIAFLDNILFFASSAADAQVMINEVFLKLFEIGLFVYEDTIQWMPDKSLFANFCNAVLVVNGKDVPLATCLYVPGSRVACDTPTITAIEHRVEAGWRCFHRWKHVSMSVANLDHQTDFFKRTVLRSLVWVW